MILETVEPNLVVAVVGATGRQGGAVGRHLLADGWRVRALTRRPGGKPARELAGLGAEVVQADWHLMPKLMGVERRIPWLCVDDLWAIAPRAFGDPDRFIGADLKLAGDLESIDECREVWVEIIGHPLPDNGQAAEVVTAIGVGLTRPRNWRSGG